LVLNIKIIFKYENVSNKIYFKFKNPNQTEVEEFWKQIWNNQTIIIIIIEEVHTFNLYTTIIEIFILYLFFKDK